jgi:hypothetical protein
MTGQWEGLEEKDGVRVDEEEEGVWVERCVVKEEVDAEDEGKLASVRESGRECGSEVWGERGSAKCDCKLRINGPRSLGWVENNDAVVLEVVLEVVSEVVFEAEKEGVEEPVEGLSRVRYISLHVSFTQYLTK